jgi:hypothetical protein
MGKKKKGKPGKQTKDGTSSRKTRGIYLQRRRATDSPKGPHAKPSEEKKPKDKKPEK